MGPERRPRFEPVEPQPVEPGPTDPESVANQPWARDDDELLLLDGLEDIDEAPDNERDDEVM
ncbi:MAG: hypothetical protein IT341_08220 [Chloroflexi bacterium]|nr:hypothetical protein [Chloroflexota bacterium]